MINSFSGCMLIRDDFTNRLEIGNYNTKNHKIKSVRYYLLAHFAYCRNIPLLKVTFLRSILLLKNK